MKRLLLLATLALAATAFAQGGPTDGEVRKVDKDTKKITLKHGEIKALDMPPMSMAYQVKDPSMLDKVQVGDKVSFTVDKVGSSYVLTSITPTK